MSFDQDYGFYNPNGDLLPMDGNVITLSKDMLPSEAFRLKMKPLAINISCALYPNILIPLEVDVSLHFSFYIPAVCRKFGYPEELFEKLTSSGTDLTVDAPISRSKLTIEQVIEVHFQPLANYPRKKSIQPREKREDKINTFTLDELIDKISLAQSEQGIECTDILTIRPRFS